MKHDGGKNKKHFLCLAVHSCVQDAHKPDKKAYLSTVLPAKSESDIMFCL